MYLNAALLIIRSKRAGGFLILHPRSAAIFPTDALGARAIRLFLLGQQSSIIGTWLERQCPGAARRWGRLVQALYDRGAVAPQAPSRTRRWWARRLAALALGPALSLLTAILRFMPEWLLLGLYERLPATPLGTRLLVHLLPFIDRNLCAAGYAGLPSARRRDIARQVSAATLRTHFVSYLGLVLPPERVFRIVERLTTVRGMDRLARTLDEHDGAVVVGLHWELFLAPVLHVSRTRPVTLLADVGMAEYSVGADREPPAPPLGDRVNSTAPMAAKDLARSLRAGRVVMLAFDVASPRARGTGTRRIRFLGHDLTRFDTAAWLSTRTGKPIHLVGMHREGSRLVVEFSPPLAQAPALAPGERVAHLTAQVYEAAETLVRRHPKAWLGWSYLHTLTVATS
jgi:lauroyl/myristoyl acyltransferase